MVKVQLTYRLTTETVIEERNFTEKFNGKHYNLKIDQILKIKFLFFNISFKFYHPIFGR